MKIICTMIVENSLIEEMTFVKNLKGVEDPGEIQIFENTKITAIKRAADPMKLIVKFSNATNRSVCVNTIYLKDRLLISSKFDAKFKALIYKAIK
jgi:hypothetical protein